ncbi:hypothetical protein TNCV_4420311 [Trichonephila clavipes]|nr:hypothetical protein TNCV_4420311 [Trichonephila clavipes]
MKKDTGIMCLLVSHGSETTARLESRAPTMRRERPRPLMLGVTGKRNAKRSSIPYLDCVCGLMWVGLPGRECPDWLVERGKKAWLQNLSYPAL